MGKQMRKGPLCPTCGADVFEWHTDDCIRVHLLSFRETLIWYAQQDNGTKARKALGTLEARHASPVETGLYDNLRARVMEAKEGLKWTQVPNATYTQVATLLDDLMALVAPEPEEKKSLKDWAEEYYKEHGVVILDPDGFDRTDPHMWSRRYTREEFEKRLMVCTIRGSGIKLKEIFKWDS